MSHISYELPIVLYPQHRQVIVGANRIMARLLYRGPVAAVALQ